MKLIIKLVAEVDNLEHAKSEWEFLDERFIIVSSELDGKEYNPALYDEGDYE